MPFDEDLSVFTSPNEFGDIARWSYGGVEINGIFDAAWVDPLGVYDGFRPVFTCAMADVPGVAQQQTLTINGTVYAIVSIRPDDSGREAMLILRT